MKAHLETNYQLIYDISVIFIRSEKGGFCKQLFGKRKNDMSKTNLSPNDQSVDIITVVNRMLHVPLVLTPVVGNSLVLPKLFSCSPNIPRVVYHAGKPIESVVYCLYIPTAQ